MAAWDPTGRINPKVLTSAVRLCRRPSRAPQGERLGPGQDADKPVPFSSMPSIRGARVPTWVASATRNSERTGLATRTKRGHLYGGWGRAGAEGNDKLHHRPPRPLTLRSETRLLVVTRRGSHRSHYNDVRGGSEKTGSSSAVQNFYLYSSTVMCFT